jgi:hypothetical protein
MWDSSDYGYSDYGYGGAYGPSSDGVYAAADNYASNFGSDYGSDFGTTYGYDSYSNEQYAQLDNPWSDANINRDALTAGDNIPAMRSNGIGEGFFGSVGSHIGSAVGGAVGGSPGGYVGGLGGGWLGSEWGRYIDPREPEPPVQVTPEPMTPPEPGR